MFSNNCQSCCNTGFPDGFSIFKNNTDNWFYYPKLVWARPETRTPFWCLTMITLLTSIMILVFFLFTLLLSLSFFGPLVSYLIIYKKTQNTEFQGKAQWIWANKSYTATDTHRLVLQSGYFLLNHSSMLYSICKLILPMLILPADYRSTMLTACVFTTWDTVWHPRRFVFRKFVHKPNCSWPEVWLSWSLWSQYYLFIYH